MAKVVLITGASSGIGEACARRFAKEGYDLILASRSKEKLEMLRGELSATGADVKVLPFDLRDRAAATAAIGSLDGKWANIDVLVNNAGLALGVDKEYEGNLDDWETVIDTNIKGLLMMTRLIVPGMVRRNHGHVINLGSVAGDYAYGGGSVYSATKFAVKALTDALRIELVDTCVRVTNIKPGLVETHFSNVRFHGDDTAADNVYKGIKPLVGDDIADVIFYAASAPAHVQVAEVTIMPVHQANAVVTSKDVNREENLS